MREQRCASSRVDMEMPQDSQGTALSSSDEVGKEAEYNYFTMPLDGIQKFFVAVSDLEVEPNLGMFTIWNDSGRHN